MRKKELLRNRRSDQIKLKVQIHHQNIVSNRLLMYNKVIILLHHIHLVGRLLHGSGRIFTITYLWITVECICIHTLFNILLYIQVMVLLKDRLLLAIIWSEATLNAVKMVRRMWSKIINIYSRGGVPQTCLTLRRGGCNGCARKSPWNNKRRLYQQGRRPQSRYGGPSEMFYHQLEEKARCGR